MGGWPERPVPFPELFANIIAVRGTVGDDVLHFVFDLPLVAFTGDGGAYHGSFDSNQWQSTDATVLAGGLEVTCEPVIASPATWSYDGNLSDFYFGDGVSLQGLLNGTVTT